MPTTPAVEMKIWKRSTFIAVFLGRKCSIHGRSDTCGQDFLVHKVLFERNAASHNGGELHVVHCAAAGVRCEILFCNLFCDPTNSGCDAGQSSRL